MTCPVDLMADVINSYHLRILTAKQREDLQHLLILGETEMVRDSLIRLKAEYDINQKPSQEKFRAKHRWTSHGGS